MTATVRGISAADRSGAIGRDGHRTYTVTYLVQTDSRNDGPEMVRTAFGIPSLGDLYYAGNDYDPRAIAVAKRVVQRDSPFEWEVEVTYTTEPGEKPDPSEVANSPLEEAAEISFGFQARKILLNGYYVSHPDPSYPLVDMDMGIVAPNGELFDPQPEVDWNEPILTIKRNVASINAADLMALANCVNSAAFYGAEARQLKMVPPQAGRVYNSVIGYYFAVTYGMAYKYDTWDLQLLNQGTFYLDALGSPTPFKDSEGNRFIGLLTSTGGALNDFSEATSGRWISGGDTPTFTRLRVFREIDFNSLGII